MTPPETRALPAWCLFRIESRPYAVGLEGVAAIVEAEGLVRLPLGAPRVLGLCTFHRDVVPVIALDPATGPAPDRARSDPRPLVLILRTEPGTWGLRIDRGGTIVAEAPLEDPGTPRPAAPGGPALIGAVRFGQATHAVLDPESTWRHLRDALQGWFRGDPGSAGPQPT